MSNMINTNYAGGNVSPYMQSLYTQHSINSAVSADKAESISAAEELSEEEKLEVFKKEIWAEINAMPRSSSINWSIQITDGGFKRMMEDEEYKEKILNYLREDVAAGRYPITTSICRIDENGGTGAAYGFGYGEDIYDAHTKDSDSFYMKKATKKIDYEELWEEQMQEMRQRTRKYRTELFDARYKEALEKKIVAGKRMQREFFESRFASGMKTVKMPQSAKSGINAVRAVSAYDANVMTEIVAGGDSLFG